jgi:hypothetical protein
LKKSIVALFIIFVRQKCLIYAGFTPD